MKCRSFRKRLIHLPFLNFESGTEFRFRIFNPRKLVFQFGDCENFLLKILLVNFEQKHSKLSFWKIVFFAKQLGFRQTMGLFIRLISKVLLKNTQILPLFGKNFETSIKTQKCCSCQRFNPKIPGFTMKNRKKTLQRA